MNRFAPATDKQRHLAALAIASGRTQAEAARAADVSPASVHEWVKQVAFQKRVEELRGSVRDQTPPLVEEVERTGWVHLTHNGCMGYSWSWFARLMKRGVLADVDRKEVRIRNDRGEVVDGVFLRRATVQRLIGAIAKLPTVAEVERRGLWMSGVGSGRESTLRQWAKEGIVGGRDMRQISVRTQDCRAVVVTFYRWSVVGRLIRERCTRRPRRKRKAK